MPQPRKRPRSAWHRFEADAPDAVWQSDMTHWRLADGSEVEICSWLDDHSRYLLECTAFGRVDGDDVVATFCAAGEKYGWPAATLTDNGAVYTSRFTGERNAFEHLLAYLGIQQRNGAPNHPQTQGKIERFQQTLERWLEQQPAARTLPELQAQLDAFRTAYDEERPHRAIGRRTPAEAYRATPKAHPAGRGAPGYLRLRYDVADKKGAITLRRAGRMHHLKIGAAHARRRVLAIVDEREVTVVDLGTGEVSSHLIEPDRGYWRNRRRDPGRGPKRQDDVRAGPSVVADVPTHVSPMSRLMTMAGEEGSEPSSPSIGWEHDALRPRASAGRRLRGRAERLAAIDTLR